MEILIFLFIAVIGFGLYKMITTSSYKANPDEFQQAGIRVVFSTGKIIIKGRTYDADAVQGISSKVVSRLGTEVYIKVDDFDKPIHKIGIMGVGDAGEKFVQRLSTALRKAGGNSFY